METKCTCERPDDNTCEYCEKQQEKSILADAKEKSMTHEAESWLKHYDKMVSVYWKTTSSKRLEEILNKLEIHLENNFEEYYIIHSKFLRLFLKKQKEELEYKFFGYKAHIDAENFVNQFRR